MKKKLLSIILASAITVLMIPAVSTPALAADSEFTTISAGTYHAMAIKTDGSLWVWGWNWAGEIGDGTPNDATEPVKIMENVVAVSAGWHYSMAICEDGSLWAWGYNEHGELGDGTRQNRYEPVKIMEDVKIVSSGYMCTWAVKTDGTLWAWGTSFVAGDSDQSLSPTQILDDVTAISADRYTVMAIKTDGTLWAWGFNSDGRLGNGTYKYQENPVKIMEDVAAVSLGNYHAMALKTDGSVWAWGQNEYGQIGDGTRTTCHYEPTGHGGSYKIYDDNNNRSLPVKIMDDVCEISAEGYSSFAIKTDGSLWAWGNNGCGQLGNGTISSYNYADDPFNASYREDNTHTSPEKVLDDVATLAADGVDGGYAMALKTDGTLWTWGRNYYTVLGKARKDSRPTPEQVLEGVLLPWQAAAPEAADAQPTAATVIVDGEVIAFDSYNINGNNYFKLRDIAYILSGSLKQFDVTWDSGKNAIFLISGLAYTVVGGEMEGKGEGDRKPLVTSSKILLDDELIKLTAYNINGNNYFKLRDIGKAFDFCVSWDSATDTITIDTSMEYAP